MLTDSVYEGGIYKVNMASSEFKTPYVLGITPNKENIGQLRDEIGKYREQKGDDHIAFALINRALPFSIKDGLHEQVVNFYLEEFLVWQHMAEFGFDV